MIVVPFSHDQPDNAARVRKMGVARVIPRDRYRAHLVARELTLLLAGDAYVAPARAAACEMQAEDGVAAACEGLEAIAIAKC